MSLAETFTTLTDAGFVTTVNSAHTRITVSLNSRPINTTEVWAALGFNIDRSRLTRQGDAVVVTE